MLLTSDVARARAEDEKHAAAAAAARGVSETYTVRTLVAVSEGDTVGLLCALAVAHGLIWTCLVRGRHARAVMLWVWAGQRWPVQGLWWSLPVCGQGSCFCA